MDCRTGEIMEKEEALRRISEATQSGSNIPEFFELEKLARKGCSRCHGRGHVGRNVQTGFVVPCKCVGKVKKIP
jgi:hypothetical protein